MKPTQTPVEQAIQEFAADPERELTIIEEPAGEPKPEWWDILRQIMQEAKAQTPVAAQSDTEPTTDQLFEQFLKAMDVRAKAKKDVDKGIGQYGGEQPRGYMRLLFQELATAEQTMRQSLDAYIDARISAKQQ